MDRWAIETAPLTMGRQSCSFVLLTLKLSGFRCHPFCGLAASTELEGKASARVANRAMLAIARFFTRLRSAQNDRLPYLLSDEIIMITPPQDMSV